MADRLDNISSPSFSFSPNHCCALTNTTKSFTEISTSTNKRNLVAMLLNMMGMIRRSQDFGLIYVIYTNSLEDLSEISRSRLRHGMHCERPGTQRNVQF